PATALPHLGITTVDQSGVTMGRQAAELLLSRLEGRREPQHVLIPPRLVVRQTTARAGDEGRDGTQRGDGVPSSAPPVAPI
ncbi:MAG: LacI family DNA-binding transcriptional regulator, partial [Sinomonas sp.]|nr:LacI family DNA-binding transcriptional regulator [Sinomonas sp.]